MSDQYLYCTCCERKLNPQRRVWLELDQRINEYHDFGGVPENLSQGGFPFGITCAGKARAKARAALQASAAGRTEGES